MGRARYRARPDESFSIIAIKLQSFEENFDATSPSSGKPPPVSLILPPPRNPQIRGTFPLSDRMGNAPPVGRVQVGRTRSHQQGRSFRLVTPTLLPKSRCLRTRQCVCLNWKPRRQLSRLLCSGGTAVGNRRETHLCGHTLFKVDRKYRNICIDPFATFRLGRVSTNLPSFQHTVFLTRHPLCPIFP